jgi:hypothetical protein
VSSPRLEDLLPIAIVIAAGCEACAAGAVRRALRLGSPRPLVERTLAIVEHMLALDCLLAAVGPEALARMQEPLAAARRAARRQSKGATMAESRS